MAEEDEAIEQAVIDYINAANRCGKCRRRLTDKYFGNHKIGTHIFMIGCVVLTKANDAISKKRR